MVLSCIAILQLFSKVGFAVSTLIICWSIQLLSTQIYSGVRTLFRSSALIPYRIPESQASWILSSSSSCLLEVSKFIFSLISTFLCAAVPSMFCKLPFSLLLVTEFIATFDKATSSASFLSSSTTFYSRVLIKPKRALTKESSSSSSSDLTLLLCTLFTFGNSCFFFFLSVVFLVVQGLGGGFLLDACRVTRFSKCVFFRVAFWLNFVVLFLT